jgi:hypothetical protein
MKQEEINEILRKHKTWLNEEIGGERANFRGADLAGADFRGANLAGADFRYANLEGADLRCANFRGANFRGANLEGADLDFSCFPLWCGSFGMKDDGHIAKQLLSHIARLNIQDEKLKKWIKQIPKEYKNDICKRHSVEEVD